MEEAMACNDIAMDNSSSGGVIAHSSSVMSFNGKRLVMDEMDFFAENDNKTISSPVNDHHQTVVHQMELHVDVGKAIKLS